MPKYHIDVQARDGEWYHFTTQPFDTQEAADRHFREMCTTFPTADHSRARVAEISDRQHRVELLSNQGLYFFEHVIHRMAEMLTDEQLDELFQQLDNDPEARCQ